MEGDLQKLVGRNVRRIRLGRNLTQQKLAEQIQMDPTYVSSIERGVRNLGLRTVERLAGMLSVPTRELLDESSAPG